jgi:uncharacterized protein (TIGR03086 family)
MADTPPPPVDLGRSVQHLLDITDGVEDAHLGRPTPCEGRTVSQLLQHIVGLTGAFRAAAEKDFGRWTNTNPESHGWPDLEDGWQDVLAERAPALVESWRSPDAWQGLTRAGGIDLPGEVAGFVALSEVVIHGWDLAMATGQVYELDPEVGEPLMHFVEQFDPAGTPGLYGPAVGGQEGGPLIDRIVARSGREPGWIPS